jgi:hypothetical protein
MIPIKIKVHNGLELICDGHQLAGMFNEFESTQNINTSHNHFIVRCNELLSSFLVLILYGNLQFI